MVESLGKLLSALPKELFIFIISILPIVELRGAVPVGAAMGIPFYINYIVSVVGNLLPIPFILLFIPKILDFLARFRLFRPVVKWLKEKADKYKDRIIVENTMTENTEEGSGQTAKSQRLSAAVFLALMAFVAIPLPGTGAWTGALVASLFNLPKRSSFLAILAGVMISGTVMCLASYGVVGFLNFLL